MLISNYSDEYLHQVGCDEAGRGCLAGPVVAAAVIFPSQYCHEGIDDSKKLNAIKREKLAADIIQHATAYAIGLCSELEIDQINILQASIEAMHRAIAQIQHPIDLLLIDGNKFKPYRSIPHRCIVQGDAKYLSIAAASILAKTHRDHLMQEYHLQYPEYNFAQNMGYASAEHIRAIEKYGYTPIHRKTFKIKKLAKQLFLFD